MVCQKLLHLLLACFVGLALAGCGGSPSTTVASTAPPMAGFALPSAPVTAGQTVTFTDTSTGNPASWAWSFGDGGSSALQNPEHAFAVAGSFTVTLTASNAAGSGTASRVVTVVVAPPVADFTATPTAGPAPLAVHFTDASAGSVNARSWSFGDGGTSTDRNPTHTYAGQGTFSVSLTVSGPGGASTRTNSDLIAASGLGPGTAWRFAVLGDTHVPAADLLGGMAASMVSDGVELVIFPGDITQSGAGASSAELLSQLNAWKSAVAALTGAGIGVYPVRGNHEADVPGGLSAWNSAFSGAWALPANGPAGETGLSYSFQHRNALFIGLDNYVSLHRVNQDWLDRQFAANTRPHVFAFGHEAAFKAFHTDGLDDHPDARDAFWASLAKAGARAYFCGHDHFFDAARIDDGDGNPGNDLYQIITGTGGGALFDSYTYNGANGSCLPTGLSHSKSNGYLLVEVSGATDQDLTVTLTFKQQVAVGSGTGFVPAYTLSYTAGGAPAALGYPIVDTGQARCYGTSAEIAPPTAGQAYFGQDAQFAGSPPAYTLSADGRSVFDNVTRLTWMRGPNTTLARPVKADKKTFGQAQAWVATVNATAYGGFSDWRLPTMKELYSLMNFQGTDPSGYTGTDTSGLTPFIDPASFNFGYGDPSQGERIIDSQYASNTVFAVNPAETGSPKLFGLNLADGRIKGYDLSVPGGAEKTFFVQLVRGSSGYGANSFTDHGDGTVTDDATGLMWSKADSGVPMTWPDALAWAQARNAQNHLGHSDWRVPNAKELHSLVNYANAPDYNGKPAIDTAVFTCTSIINENGDADFPWYWTSTTHGSFNGLGGSAVYIPFGRALGWPGNGWVDVHGAGCQRSDPKTAPPYAYATLRTVTRGGVTFTGYSHGPQGDALRGLNFVRLVR